ncbi:MAG: ABC transporter permease [Cellulosilyticaceae bacterium]
MRYGMMIFHSIKLKLKDYKMLFMMILFPVILTSIFAYVFSQAYGEQTVEGRIGIAVREADTDLGERYIAFMEMMAEKLEGLSIERVSEAEAMVVVDEKADRFILQKQEDDVILEGTSENMTKTFLDTVALERILVEEERGIPTGELQIVDTTGLFTVDKLETSKTQDIVTNMIIAMLVFAMVLGGQFGVGQVGYLTQAVGKRITTASLKKEWVYGCEMIGCWLTCFGIDLIVAGAFEAIFDLGLDKNVIGTVAVVGMTTLLATLLGTAIGLMGESKNMEDIYSFVATAIVILSGGLVPQLNFGMLSYMSPVKASMDSLRQIITVGSIENMGHLLLTMGVVGVVVIGMAIIYLKKGAMRRG